MLATQMPASAARQNRLDDDLENAKLAAKKFLEGSHPVIIFKDAVREGNIWTVMIGIGQLD